MFRKQSAYSFNFNDNFVIDQKVCIILPNNFIFVDNFDGML